MKFSLTARLINVLLFFVFISTCAFAQKKRSDSLLVELDQAKEDSTKCRLLIKLAFEMRSSDSRSALSYGRQAFSLAQKTGDKRNTARALNNIGLCFYYLSEYDSAISNYNRALTAAKSIPDSLIISTSFNHLGNTFKQLSNFPLSIEYHKRSFNIRKNQRDTSLMAQSLQNLGNSYVRNSQYELAIDCYQRSIELAKGKHGTEYATSLNGIANVYAFQRNYPKAIEFYKQALDLYKAADEKRGISTALLNIGSDYNALGQTDLALQYLNQCIEIRQQSKNTYALAEAYSSISEVYSTLHDFKKAIGYNRDAAAIYSSQKLPAELADTYIKIARQYIESKDMGTGKDYLKRGIAMLDSVKEKTRLISLYRDISSSYAAMGDNEKAYHFLDKSYQLRDSLLTLTSIQTIAQMQSAFDLKSKESEIEMQNRENDLLKSVNARQQLIIYFLIGGSILFIVMGFFIYRGYRKSKEANSELSKAYVQIDEKNKNISMSIDYAKNIQNALLKIPEYFDDRLHDQYFILYKPKDVVSGDIYWIEPLDKLILVAAADCTGHGVPGALMSMLAMEKLKQAVREKKLSEPAEILSFVNRSFKETLSSGEKKLYDGMDIALCCLNIPEVKMTYAGANRPLWITTYENGKRMLNSVKPNKVAIGGFTSEDQTFSTFEYYPKKGDVIYIFTDGFADQFGGPDNKKFNLKRFHNLLLSISELSMEEQKQRLEKEFETWKGSNEQVDDVLVIGMTKG